MFGFYLWFLEYLYMIQLQNINSNIPSKALNFGASEIPFEMESKTIQTIWFSTKELFRHLNQCDDQITLTDVIPQEAQEKKKNKEKKKRRDISGSPSHIDCEGIVWILSSTLVPY